MATKILSFPGGNTGMVYDQWYAVPVDGIWTYDNTYNGLSKMIAVGGFALDDLLQGYIVDNTTGAILQDPYNFGGLTPDNTANGYNYITPGQYSVTTTMPNSNKPLITHVVDTGYQYCFRVAKVESANVIWLEDPTGQASGLIGISFYGINQNLTAMTKVKVVADDRVGICLASQLQAQSLPAGEYVFNANTNGIVEPFVIFQNDGNITVTITE